MLVEILEQLLAGQFLRLPDDAHDAAVDEVELPLLAGFALEGEADAAAFDRDMPLAQRGQPETLVVARIGRVADPDHGVVEQPDRPKRRPCRATGRGA